MPPFTVYMNVVHKALTFAGNYGRPAWNVSWSTLPIYQALTKTGSVRQISTSLVVYGCIDKCHKI